MAALLVRPGERAIDSVGIVADPTLAPFARWQGHDPSQPGIADRPGLTAPDGAAAAFRRVAWEQVGGMDEQLLHHQDFEVGMRVHAAGWGVALARDAVAVHVRSATRSNVTAKGRREAGFGRAYILRRYGVLHSARGPRALVTEALVVLADLAISRDLVALRGRLAGWRAAAGRPGYGRPGPGVLDERILVRREPAHAPQRVRAQGHAMSAPTAVVHLVRRLNGLEPFEQFMTSYERHDAGSEHELVLLYKGFESPDELTPYRRRADGHAVHEIHVDDAGVDLGAYLETARQLPHRRICPMNSWSRVLVTGWLERLERALDLPRAGIAGASGSWASHRSAWLSRFHLPNGYGGELGDLRPMVDAMETVDQGPPPGLANRLFRAARGVPVALFAHAGFPSPHVRPTTCLIDRELLLSLNSGRVPTKTSSYRIESGRRGWTTQLIERGLVPYVVGRDSGALAPEQWPDADVFWQGAQGELLVADRKTAAYDYATVPVREIFARYAWGPRGRAS